MKRFYFFQLMMPIIALLGLNVSSFAQAPPYTAAGSYTYTVPAGCSSVSVDVRGAQGGSYNTTGVGGKGGRVEAVLAVTPGQILYVYVGGAGGGGSCGSAGSSTGGEAGGAGGCSGGGSGGGGGSDIRTSISGGATGTTSLASRVVVGGGGGGGNFSCSPYLSGGAGGAPNGGSGVGSCSSAAGGGTPTGGGAGTCYSGCGGTGGFGGGGGGTYWGGGGGGGWYGGGGGSESSGGGGSSYAGTGTSSVVFSNGYQSSTGYVNIVPLVPVVTAAPASLDFGNVTVGTASAPALYVSLTGSYLTGAPLTVSVPAGFSIFDAGTNSWLAGPSSINITGYSGGVLSPYTNVYVKFNPSAIGPVSAALTVTGGGLAATYNVPLSGNGVNLCSGTPVAGSAQALNALGGSSGGAYTNFTLSLLGTSGGGGLTYQWQSSPTGTSGWTNIAGAVTPTWVISGITATTYYRCIVTCPSGGSATSSNATATYAGLASSSCTPTCVNSLCCNFFVGNPSFPFYVVGDGGTSITDPANTGAKYYDQTATLGCNMSPGSTYTTVNVGYATNPMACQIWIDFNNDGTFATGESVGGSIFSSGTAHPAITVPSTGVNPGVYRMRVEVTYTAGYSPGANASYPSYPSLPPCSTTTVQYSETRDYTVTIGAPACSGAPYPGIADASVASACAAFAPNLYNVGRQIGSGLSYQWESAPSPTGPWSSVGPSGTNVVYTPTITTAGTIYYSVRVSCGASSSRTNPQTITLNTPPSPISGTTNVCTGLFTPLFAVPTGGTWTTGSTSIATAGSATGIVTGVAVGVTDVTYTIPSTGCFSTAPLTVNQLPAPITGSLAFCQGSTSTLSDAIGGGTWSCTTVTVASVTPTGGVVSGINGGSANVTYTLPTGCTTVSTVTVNALPPLFIVSVSGSASYCAGSPSTANITLTGSNPGISYQLMLAGSPVGSPLAGTGGPLSFGIQTTPGNYTVFATNTVTGCSRSMISSVTVVVSPLPNPQSVSGGGSFCAGGSGVPVFLSGSELGVNYILKLGSTTIVSLPGTGGSINFGPQTAAGIYTVMAQNATTGCTLLMTGTATITLNPLPTAFNVTGGGGYCAGGTGVPVDLDFSNSGISYQLYNGATAVGSPVLGTGGIVHFGMQIVPGTYTVTATNTSTGCVNNMNFSAVVNINPLPTVYNVTGGGAYCSGGTGTNIFTDGSDPGVNYQLNNGTSLVGGVIPGYGLGLTFGSVTSPGTYSVIAVDPATGCTNTMNGTAIVNVNPLPTVYTVSGGGNYCAGGSGVHINLSSSSTGISYQLLNGLSPVTTMSGSGSALDFGLFNTTGVYTVVATNTTTGCSNTMAGSATVAVNPLPTAFNVTGTGAYCAGGTGVNVGLDFSAAGVNYQLMRGSTMVGAAVSGTGAPLSFGPQTIAGTYTVVATNTATGCTNTMNGSAVVSINSLPTVHIVTGGGNFCATGAGVNVGLNGSETGISYQLYLGLGTVGSPVAGTGTVISFGLQTLAGTYTVVATDVATGCSRSMVGGANVVVNPLPIPYTITGGGIYCNTGTGVHIGLSGSSSGIKYQLMNGSSTAGIPLNGTGSALDFGLQIATGTYTIVATNPTTGCTAPMSGSTVVATSALPAAHLVTGGGAYCVGGSGYSIGLDASDPGISYQLYLGTTMAGSAIVGSGSSVDFGAQTAAGVYTVKATDLTTGCSGNMAGSASIIINALPAAYTVLGGGNYCAGGAGQHIFLNLSNPGVEYQLYAGSTSTGTAVPGTGSSLDFGLQTTAGAYSVIATNTATGCSNNMAGTATIGINPLPGDHNVTGGGGYCAGGTGVTIGLDGTETGVKYQLMMGTSSVGVPVSGTGTALSFGPQMTAGAYTVVATNISTACNSTMTGSADVSINPLPAAFSMTGGGNYCSTGIGVHVNLNGSETGVHYQLYRAGTPVGLYEIGTGGTLDMGLQTVPGSYTVMATDPTTGCVKSMTGTSMVNVIPVVIPAVNITPSIPGIVCVGQTVHFSASPINGGTAPTYQWWVNGISAGVGNSYSYMPVDGDVVTAQVNSNQECAIPTTGSSSVTVNVSAMQMPSATVAVYPGSTVCTGSLTTYTASTLYGGTTPALNWIKNGAYAGTGTTYSYVPSNGDIITFQLGSNFNCRLADTVYSAPVAMTVENPVLPTVSVTANTGTSINPGQQVTFTATSPNAGPHPAYQWVVNSVPVAGATMPTFTTSSLANKDSVTCEVTGVCALVGFNSVIMRVGPTGINTVSAAGNDIRLIPNPNKGEFSIKGSFASANNEAVTIEVTNMLGQVVYTGTAAPKNGNIDEHISLSSVANGMYLLSLRSGADHTVFHFVIEQ